MVCASVDMGIQNVSIRGWANIGHRSINFLPHGFRGTLPNPTLVPGSLSDGSQATQDVLQRIRPGEPVALASP